MSNRNWLMYTIQQLVDDAGIRTMMMMNSMGAPEICPRWAQHGSCTFGHRCALAATHRRVFSQPPPAPSLPTAAPSPTPTPLPRSPTPTKAKVTAQAAHAKREPKSKSTTASSNAYSALSVDSDEDETSSPREEKKETPDAAAGGSLSEITANAWATKMEEKLKLQQEGLRRDRRKLDREKRRLDQDRKRVENEMKRIKAAEQAARSTHPTATPRDPAFVGKHLKAENAKLRGAANIAAHEWSQAHQCFSEVFVVCSHRLGPSRFRFRRRFSTIRLFSSTTPTAPLRCST